MEEELIPNVLFSFFSVHLINLFYTALSLKGEIKMTLVTFIVTCESIVHFTVNIKRMFV